MKLRPLTILLTFLAAATLGLPGKGSVPSAWAQASPTEPPLRGPSPIEDGDGERGGGNYDYFTANLRPELAKYLSLVTARHASERVWAVFREGQYAEPLGDCRYTLERFPNHPRGLHLIGEIAKAMNQSSMAIPFYENALRLYPQYAFTHAQYGRYLIEIGAVPAGVSQLREALRIDPAQFQAKAWLSEALAKHPDMAGESVAKPSSTPAPAPAPAPKSAQPPRKR